MSLPKEAAARKDVPMARGLLDYFPDALAAVAEVSRVGNEQHNPGQPLHWAKEKSTDHADCIIRHLVDRGTLDTDGQRHAAKVAWRALALLQIELDEAAIKAAAEAAPEPFWPSPDMTEAEWNAAVLSEGVAMEDGPGRDMDAPDWPSFIEKADPNHKYVEEARQLRLEAQVKLAKKMLLEGRHEVKKDGKWIEHGPLGAECNCE